jgi:SAM-dependent methyltransferase
MPVKQEANWTPEVVGRFWDWISSNPRFDQTYFSYTSGAGIVSFLREAGSLHGPALDFGCGRGDLVRQMLLAGVTCGGADFSPKSLRQCDESFGADNRWLGARLVDLDAGTSFPDASFALITCVEVVEHLPQACIEQTFAELFRMLRPGGVLLVTTPFEEKLNDSHIYCPFCESEFHRWQHMRSITRADLMMWADNVGLQPIFCEPIDFPSMDGDLSPWPGWRLASYEAVRNKIDWALLGLFDRINPKPFPSGRRMKIRLSSGAKTTLCMVGQKLMSAA